MSLAQEIATKHYGTCHTTQEIQALEDAIKSERERIADLLIYGQGNPLIRAMECNESGCYPASAIELGKHLEPK